MIRLVPSTAELLSIELDIMNSDEWFNKITKDKERFSEEEVLVEIQESNGIGAERFLILDGDQYVGIMEYLMLNPSDGFAWLGLLLVKKGYQGKRYGVQALQLYEARMLERGVTVIRLGALLVNDPGRRFWQQQGFKEVEVKNLPDGKEVMVYEKQIG